MTAAGTLRQAFKQLCGDTPRTMRALPSGDGERAATDLNSIRGKNSSGEGEKRTESAGQNLPPALPMVGKSRVLSGDVQPPGIDVDRESSPPRSGKETKRNCPRSQARDGLARKKPQRGHVSE